jgi:hypothetical protein
MATLETSPARRALETRGPVLQALIDQTRADTTASYAELTLPQLKAIAVSLQIPVSGNKTELADRIAAHVVNKSPELADLNCLKDAVDAEQRTYNALHTLVREAAAELAELDARRAKAIKNLDLMARLSTEVVWLGRESVRVNATLDAGFRAMELLKRYAAAPENVSLADLAFESVTRTLVEELTLNANTDDASRAVDAACQIGARTFLRVLWRILPEPYDRITQA